MPRNVVVLGSTGSIGRQTLDVVRALGDRVRIVGLAAGSNASLLSRQAHQFKPAFVSCAATTPDQLPDGVTLLSGERAMAQMASLPEVELVVVGTSGWWGLMPTLAALEAGKLVALANKEALVMAGGVIRDQLTHGGSLVPIDSEHSAIWQCLQGEPREAIARITLTASGGALRDLSPAELARVTPAQALRHPTWSMGRKITIDSANLMNKGLEAIEARWLFDVPQERVDVVLHPQSIVHSLVTFDDGSTKAQLGVPDMRLPIQYALSHPERWSGPVAQLDLTEVGALDFAPVDLDRYPALRLALEAGQAGGTYPAVLCAADEVAVEAFLSGSLGFTDIPRVVAAALDQHTPCGKSDLNAILSADRWAREAATRLVAA
jgi:1-deoxy-D-xylulose-5-phosphate reductoisomerase